MNTLLTVDEVAERLHRSTRWVRDQIKHDGLSAVRLAAGRYLVDEADLNEWIERKKRPHHPIVAGISEASVRRLRRDGQRKAASR